MVLDRGVTSDEGRVGEAVEFAARGAHERDDALCVWHSLVAGVALCEDVEGVVVWLEACVLDPVEDERGRVKVLAVDVSLHEVVVSLDLWGHACCFHTDENVFSALNVLHQHVPSEELCKGDRVVLDSCGRDPVLDQLLGLLHLSGLNVSSQKDIHGKVVHSLARGLHLGDGGLCLCHLLFLDPPLDERVVGHVVGRHPGRHHPVQHVLCRRHVSRCRVPPHKHGPLDHTRSRPAWRSQFGQDPFRCRHLFLFHKPIQTPVRPPLPALPAPSPSPSPLPSLLPSSSLVPSAHVVQRFLGKRSPPGLCEIDCLPCFAEMYKLGQSAYKKSQLLPIS